MLEEWLYESIISSALPYNVDSFSFGLSVHRGRYRNPALFRLTIQVTAAPRAGARRRVVEDIDGFADEFEEEFDEEADEELRNEDDEDDAEGMYSQRRVRDHNDGLEPEDGQEDQDEEIERDVGAGSGYACAVEESSSAPKVRARRFSAAKTFIRGAASPGKGLRRGTVQSPTRPVLKGNGKRAVRGVHGRVSASRTDKRCLGCKKSPPDPYLVYGNAPLLDPKLLANSNNSSQTTCSGNSSCKRVRATCSSEVAGGKTTFVSR